MMIFSNPFWNRAMMAIFYTAVYLLMQFTVCISWVVNVASSLYYMFNVIHQLKIIATVNRGNPSSLSDQNHTFIQRTKNVQLHYQEMHRPAFVLPYTDYLINGIILTRLSQMLPLCKGTMYTNWQRVIHGEFTRGYDRAGNSIATEQHAGSSMLRRMLNITERSIWMSN